MWHHPNYYKELRRRNREVLRSGRGLAVNQAPHVSDQAISYDDSTESQGVRPGPGPKPQATSYKLPGPRPISNANKGLLHKRQAPSSDKKE